MHRIEGAFYDDSGGTNLFQDSSNGGTRVTAAWLNSVQEELCNLLTELGGTVTTQGLDTTKNQIYSILATAGIAAPATYTIDPMSASTTFATFYGFQKIFFLNPDGAYNFNPYGSFIDGVSVVIVNINGVNDITFDSDTLAETVAAGDGKRFIYDGTNYLWRYTQQPV
jgi:hypothetical protein